MLRHVGRLAQAHNIHCRRNQQQSAEDGCLILFRTKWGLERWQKRRHTTADGQWQLDEKFYFHQRGAKVSAADYHSSSGMLVVGFTNGIFDLYEMPAFQNVHTLSVTRERISAATFNTAGNWVSRTPFRHCI